MKTSLAGIAWIAWFILNLSHQVAAKYLEEDCRTLNNRASTWMVALRNETNYMCAGSLIHRRFVLTAAECVGGQRTIIAMLGANNITHPAAEVPVSRVLSHRSYSRETGMNNIALAMLLHKVNYNDHIRPICINLTAVRSYAESYWEFETFDWGIRQSEILQGTKIVRRDRINCGKALDQSYICGGPSRTSDCGGDTGGPLSISIASDSGSETHPVQLGIVSSGQRPFEGLRAYVDVTSYTDWIEQIVRAFDTLDAPEVVSQSPRDPRPPPRGKSDGRNQNRQPERTESKEMWLYNDCGQKYLIGNIFGPDFMAKGVMITHRFVLTAASGLPEDVTPLRVGVPGEGTYQEIEIHSVYKRPESDIAVLKLNRELVREDSMKPICMLRRATSGAYTPQVAVLDVDRTEKPISARYMISTPLRCPASLRKSIDQSKICVQNPPGLKQFFGIRGNVLAKTIVPPGQSKAVYALFGLVTHSSNGILVITNVGPYTDWIVSVVSENSAGNTTST